MLTVPALLWTELHNTAAIPKAKAKGGFPNLEGDLKLCTSELVSSKLIDNLLRFVSLQALVLMVVLYSELFIQKHCHRIDYHWQQTLHNFIMLSHLYDYLRELLLNPPLSPGGSPSAHNDISSILLHDNDNINSTNSDPLLLRYLPLLVLLTLFWPIFVTLIATSLSASAWLFWLAIGATTGLVQLLYVIYNFFMITWDLAILVVLKTFSMIRSRSRRYYYKAVFATYKSMGIERKSRKGKMGSHHVRRRRKEWSQDVARATSFKEFEEIEIYEPTIHASGGGGGDGSKTTIKKKKRLSSIATRKPNLIKKSVSTGINMNLGGTTAGSSGLRRRKQSSSSQQQNDNSNNNHEPTTTQFPPSSPIKTIEESPMDQPPPQPSASDSPMRKIHSCLELKRGQSSTSKLPTTTTSNTTNTANLLSSPRGIRWKPIRKTITTHNKPWIAPIKRTYSSSSLPHNSEHLNHDCANHDHNEEEEEESCPTWQNVVKDDLGMEGSMLLTTLARLKEARLQAMQGSNVDHSAAAADHDSDDDNNQDEEEDDAIILPSLSSLSKEEEDETEDDPTRKRSSYHITASFNTTQSSSSSSTTIPKRKKQWNEDYSSSLKTLLSGIVKRNHLSIEDWLIQDARSVAERGQHSLRKETRDAIDRYGDEVERCMDWIANGPVYLGPKSGVGGNPDEEENDVEKKKVNTQEDVMEKQREELSKRYTLVKRMKQNVGHTALMLSGGGAQTMYHLGSIKALVEAGVYEHIHVISGTSGGSISAAMCAIKTPAELLTDICVRTVSADYMLTGEQKKQNVRWFPTAFDMGAFFIKNRIVVDGDEFKRCCDFYFKDITFEEAYEMTRKHVCITVTASRATSGKGMQRLLLNHISTPNVTLASAVRASCAVPGFFTAATLMIKDSRGKEVPFEVDGVEWIDGSVQADIPVKRISTLFNVSNYVVCQTNFHGNRLAALSQFGLLPKLFGNDLSKMFRQRYYGDLTLVPKFTTAHKFGLSILSNPTEKDMDVYLQGGQAAAWPFIRSLQEMLHLERSIHKCLNDLGERLRSVTSGLDLNLSNDDVDSVSSVVGAAYRARLPGLGREAELLREKVQDLETENDQLKRKVQRLQRALGISPSKSTFGGLEHIVSVDEGEVHEDI
eukprot:scaffold2051_cov139-Skeletonema_marinoi.AAC.30